MACSVSLIPICFHSANNSKTALNPSPIKISKATPRSRTFTQFAIPPIPTAPAYFASVDGMTTTTIGGSSVAVLAAVLTLTDPKRRRQLQAVEVGCGDMEVVRGYLNNSGFQRWKKIYGETDDVKDLILRENAREKKRKNLQKNVVLGDSL